MNCASRHLLLLLLAASIPLAAGAARPSNGGATPFAAPGEDDFYSRYVADRLSAGLAYTRSSFRKTHVPYDRTQKSNYLGNLNRLEEADVDGFGLSLQYDFSPQVALCLAKGTSASLRTWNADNSSCDGSLELSGYSAEVLFRHPIAVGDTILFPTVGIGAEYVTASYKASPWWHLGWSSPEDYEHFGNGSGQPRGGVVRQMSVEDPGVSPILSIGLTARVSGRCDVDLFWQCVGSADADASFYRQEGSRRFLMRDGSFPTEHTAVLLAVRYVF